MADLKFHRATVHGAQYATFYKYFRQTGFLSVQAAEKSLTKIISVNLTGLEPNAVKQYVAGQSGMLFSERPFALGLFLGKQMKQQ